MTDLFNVFFFLNILIIYLRIRQIYLKLIDFFHETASQFEVRHRTVIQNSGFKTISHLYRSICEYGIALVDVYHLEAASVIFAVRKSALSDF